MWLPMAQQIKACGGIQDKWSYVRMQNRSNQKSKDATDGSKPQRRLVRGPKNHLPSPVGAAHSRGTTPKKPGRLIGGTTPSCPCSGSPVTIIITEDDPDSSVKQAAEHGGLETKLIL